MGITNTITRARVGTGITLTGLSKRTGIGLSNLSAIEHGRRNPTASALDRILAGAGLKVLAYNTHGRATLAEIAIEQAQSGDADGFRTLVQASDNLQATTGLDRLLLALEEPPTLTPEWDAALAGIAELRLTEDRLPVPPWVVQRPGDARWGWSPDYGLVTTRYRLNLDQVPAPLRSRGILIEASELESA